MSRVLEVNMKNGLYEQIINTKIHSALQKLDPDNFDIQKDNLNADDSSKLLTLYISNVIRKGLKYIRDGYSSSKEKEALVAQIKLCNDIISEIADHANDTDFSDYTILEQGEVLTSLYRKLLSPNKVIKPETSISENALFTGSKSEPSMLSELKKEILSSDSVDIIVSFIRWSAIHPLLSDLREFTERSNTKLRVLTTTYMRATEYKAVLELSKLKNTEVKINYETSNERMHAKSYIFKRDTGFSTVYIGSSNLSNAALTSGLEWNVKVTEKESFDVVKRCEVSFESYWNNDSFEWFDPNDAECCTKLENELSKKNWNENNPRHLHLAIRPYVYQQEVLDNLDAERDVYGHYKNLVVAATGVGKTIIAAFDYKRFKDTHPRARLLFVAHRKEILEQSMEKFQEVLNDFNFGELFVDGRRPSNIDYLFISIQSLNSASLINHISKDYYDYIVVDEFHHAAAPSYQDLLKYFKPKILLGLTATPDRMDGKNILEYFDGRIASKLLLGEAIDRNLLSKFQYYGITDDVDYSRLRWINGKYDINELENVYTADTIRCALILNKVREYVADMDEVKGLGFCVSIAHAEYMAEYFCQHGINSIALSARSVDGIREDAKSKLISGEIKFIFVVDLYNEGVDIPEVNTILFLRPTESATVFIQQLGRGLRLSKGKDCLTVLDFVGRSNKKYRFDIKLEALAGRGRKSIAKQVAEDFSNLPRGCYIEFERVAKEYILENLRQSDNTKDVLIEKVRTFEGDTGLPLTLTNFLTENNLSLYDFYQSSGTRSLYRLKKWANIINDTRDVDDSVYRRFAGLFHINSVNLLDFWINYIENGKKPKTTNDELMRNMLYYTFFQKAPEREGFKSIDEGIESYLEEDFIKDEVLQILKYNRAHINFVAIKNEFQFNCPIEVHCKYNKNQILAAFNYYNESEAPEFREGVKYLESQKTDAFFINLNKSERDFSPSTMYEDYAINSSLFHWQSQSQDRQASPKIQRYINHKASGNVITLFVREFKKIGSYTAPYTFIGNADYVKHEGEKPVSFIWKLHTPIPAELLPKANKTVAI